MIADVFISYASEDHARAAAVVAVLERRGWSVWWDRRIPTGEDYQRYIEARLHAARCVIVLWSAHSAASRWVRAEANSALERGILVPASINGAEPPMPFNTIQTARLADWDGTSPHPELDRLLAGVAVRLGARPVMVTAPQRPSGSRHRRVVVGLLVVHVAVALGLVLIRVRTTDVRLELHVAEAGFRSSAQQPLITAPMRVATLGASGLAAVDLPQAGGAGSERYAEPSLLLTALGEGVIQLEPFRVPASTPLALRVTDEPGAYRLSLEGAIPTLEASVLGPVRVVVPRVLKEDRNYAYAKVVELHTDSAVLDLEFAVPAGQGARLAARLAAGDLRLDRIEWFDGEPVVMSTIVSGQLSYVTADRDGQAFTEGETLRFRRSEGEVQLLRVAGGDVALTFAGHVRGMTVGSGGSQRSLMPTWLEWLKGRPVLWMLKDVYLALLGLTLAAIQWWAQAVDLWRKLSTRGPGA